MPSAETPPPPVLIVDQVLQQAVAHHQAGQLRDAERLYRRVLQVQPDNPDANHNLGVLTAQVGQPAAGLPHLRAALEAKPAVGRYWLSYIAALIQTGQSDAARQALTQGRQRGLQGREVEVLERRLERGSAQTAAPLPTAAGNGAEPSTDEINALLFVLNEGRHGEAETLARSLAERFPRHGFGWKMLGATIAVQGRSAEALAPMQRAAELLPWDHEAQSNLGLMLGDLNRLAEAEDCHRRALQIKPGDADSHNNLGIILIAQGRLSEAESTFRRALELDPDCADAYGNLGNALKAQGRLPEAETSYRKALAIKPDYVKVHYNLGMILHAQGWLPEAEASYRKALETKPDYAEAHNGLGLTLHAQGRLTEAEANYRKALRVKPDDAEANNNLGITLYAQGRLSEAETSLRRALVIAPDHAEAHNNLGNTLQGQGLLREAEASYRKALEIKPDYWEVHSNLLINRQYDPTFTANDVFEAHCDWAARHVGTSLPSPSSWQIERSPDRRLRVGLFSPAFRQGPTGIFVEPLFRHLDRQSFELWCYSNTPLHDEQTRRLRGMADAWCDVIQMSDALMAERIRHDRIDILIDLAGHTPGHRLPAIARKPAPVIVTWLDYWATTAVPAVDYLIADSFSVPPGSPQRFTEKVLVLDPSRFCYTPPSYAPDVAPAPVERRGEITFGSFNRLSKLAAPVLELWARVLREVEPSRLVLKNSAFADAKIRKRLLAFFAERGVDASRVELRQASPHASMLAEYGEIDIALDPFPYNGGLTTCEAMWMGVPVLCALGNSMISRQSASLLAAVGLDEFTAPGHDEYVRLARQWANDRKPLALLRAELRPRMRASPLCDGVGFATRFGQALRAAWADCCAGLASSRVQDQNPRNGVA